MPNFNGTGPADAGAFAGAGRGRGGRGFGGNKRFGCVQGGRRARNRQHLALQAGLMGRNNQESGWQGRCIERLEQHIAVLQQRLGMLKAQSGKHADSA